MIRQDGCLCCSNVCATSPRPHTWAICDCLIGRLERPHLECGSLLILLVLSVSYHRITYNPGMRWNQGTDFCLLHVFRIFATLNDLSCEGRLKGGIFWKSTEKMERTREIDYGSRWETCCTEVKQYWGCVLAKLGVYYITAAGPKSRVRIRFQVLTFVGVVDQNVRK
jgi:hypothetical protein